MDATVQNNLSPAHVQRMQKEKFEREMTAKGWVKDTPHPLYHYINYGDMATIAKIVKVSENYVRMLLRGTVSWEALDNKRGDTKRQVLWKAQDYIWNRIVQKATERNPKPKAVKGKRKRQAPPQSPRRGEGSREDGRC